MSDIYSVLVSLSHHVMRSQRFCRTRLGWCSSGLVPWLTGCRVWECERAEPLRFVKPFLSGCRWGLSGPGQECLLFSVFGCAPHSVTQQGSHTVCFQRKLFSDFEVSYSWLYCLLFTLLKKRFYASLSDKLFGLLQCCSVFTLLTS